MAELPQIRERAEMVRDHAQRAENAANKITAILQPLDKIIETWADDYEVSVSVRAWDRERFTIDLYSHKSPTKRLMGYADAFDTFNLYRSGYGSDSHAATRSDYAWHLRVKWKVEY